MKAPELKPGQCDSYTSDALKRMDEAVKLSYETVERETCREAERNGRTTATVADVESALNRIVVSVTGWDDEPPRNDEFPWIKVEPQSDSEWKPGIDDLIADQALWSQATFGDDCDRGPMGALKHLEKEARECQQAPNDIEEYADCLLLLLDATRRAGWAFEQLVDAGVAKMAKNKQRSWPKPTSDEPVEHVKQVPPPEPPAEPFKAGDLVVPDSVVSQSKCGFSPLPLYSVSMPMVYVDELRSFHCSHFRHANADEIAAYRKAQED